MTPNRSISYRGSEVAAISIAQHMMPKCNGHVEFRFAQLKNSPTSPALSRSRMAPPGPRLIGASMFSSTHWTNLSSGDRRYSPAPHAGSFDLAPRGAARDPLPERSNIGVALNPSFAASHPRYSPGSDLWSHLDETNSPVGLKVRHASHRDARFESGPGGPPRVRREQDAGIQERAGIERFLNPSHDAVRLASPHARQRFRTNPSDSVLARWRAAKTVEQCAVELLSQRPHALEILWVGRVEERTIVRIPVSDVAVDPREGPVTPREVHEEGHELRHPVARDDRVFHEAPRFARPGPLDDGREQGSPDFPESRLTHRIGRDLGVPTQPIATRDAPDHGVRGRIEVALVELNEQHRPRRLRNAEGLPVQQGEGVPVDGLDRARTPRQDVGDGRTEIFESVA